jgi:hypothetical protein
MIFTRDAGNIAALHTFCKGNVLNKKFDMKGENTAIENKMVLILLAV